MEQMPHQDQGDGGGLQPLAQAESAVVEGWRTGLPLLVGAHVMLRDLRLPDAPSLYALLATEDIRRFISPPPDDIEGFERFIAWAHGERVAGKYLCFAVVPLGGDVAVGLFQVRRLGITFHTAEWGFALGKRFWGSGLFVEAARLVTEFAFESVGIQRLEARASVDNGRGNGALAKIGAQRESVLRKSFMRNGRYVDQFLWAILAPDAEMSRHRQLMTVLVSRPS